MAIQRSFIGYYVHSSPKGSSSGSLRVYIPELMPGIGMGQPKGTPSSVNTSAMANASDCKPPVSTSISSQNYITAKAPFTSFRHPLYYYGSPIGVVTEGEDNSSFRLAPEIADYSAKE